MKKKDYRNYLILIGIISIVYLAVTYFTNIFGSDTDFLNQHTIFPDYFRQLFYQTGKIIPNFALNYGAGQNLFNLSYYGFLSPIFLPSYLLPFMDMLTYTTIANFIVIVTSAILFYNFIKKNGFNENISLISSIIFVLADSFIFHMHRHLMFVSYMPFLIMGLLGVDKLLKNNKRWLLIISIFLMIMTSYYYSVAGILAIIIYYLYKYFSDQNNHGFKIFLSKGLKFGICIIIPVLMASIFLLPTLSTILGGRGVSDQDIKLISLFIPSLKIHKLFCGTYTIGLSILAVISLLYLFYTKKRNNVIIATIISIILFIPIFMLILNGGLYLRAKCFIPFMPLFAYFIAMFLNDLYSHKIKIKSFTIFVITVSIISLFFNLKWHCYIYLGVYLLMFIIYDKYKCQKILTLFLILLSLGTCLYRNFTEDYITIKYYNELFSKDISQNIDEVLLKDNTYYRTNNLINPTKTVNKIYNQNYFTTNIYSSTYNNYYLNFVRNIFKKDRLEYNYFMIPSSNNLLFNQFMGVKYLSSEYDPGLGYTKVGNNMYMNENVLPMFYATSHILNKTEFEKYDYPNTLELLLNNVIVEGKEQNSNIITHVEKVDLKYEVIEQNGVVVSKSDNGYVLTVTKEGNIKVKLKENLENKILFINLYGLENNSCQYDNITLKINNVENLLTCKSWEYDNQNETFRYVLSDKDLSEINIKLSPGTYNIVNYDTFVLDYDYIKNVKDNVDEFTITEFSNDKIIGNVNVSNDGYFVTSIPYDKGFTVMIDGQEGDYEMVNEGFVGFPITKGDHEVTIIYHSPWLKEGSIISVIGMFMFGIVLIIDYKNKKGFSI